MPIIPRVNPEISPIAPLPGVRDETRFNPNPLAGLADSINHVGRAVAGVYQKHQDQVDTAAVMEAKRKRSDRVNHWYDPNNKEGITAYQGRDALKLPDAMLPDLDKFDAEIEATLPSDRARLMFREHAIAERDSEIKSINRYATAQNEAYLASEREAYATSAANDYVGAILRGDDDRAAMVLGDAERTITMDAAARGRPAKETALRLDTFRSQSHAAVIGSLLQQDFETAELYFQEHREDLLPDDLIRIEGALRPVAEMVDVEAAVDRIEQGLPVDTGPSADYQSKRRTNESSNNPQAVNPTTGAAGPDQFLASTWLGLVERHQPGWAKGLNREQLLAARHDVDKSTEMVEHFDRENAGVLRRGGAPVNDGTMYLAHHFGAEGALKILAADDSTPMQRLVTPAAYAANPRLHGKTKGDELAYIARKGFGAVDTPPQTTSASSPPATLADKLAAVDAAYPRPGQVRQRAAVKAAIRAREAERQTVQAAQERALQDDLFTRLETADPSQPLGKILSPEQLAWAQREGRVSELDARRVQRVQGAFVQDDPALVEALYRERALSPDTFATRVLQANADKLSTATLTDLLQSQQQLAKREAPADYASEEQQLTMAFEDAGIPGGKPGDARRGQLRRAYYEEIRARVRESGKKPDAEQRRAILKSLTLQTIRNERSDPDERRAFEATPGEGDKIYVPDPAAHAIAARFKKRTGRAPSEAEIRLAYLQSVRNGAEW